MTKTLRILVATALLFGADWGIASEAVLSHAWFKPSLTTNKDAICDEVLASAKAKFVSGASWLEYSPGPVNVLDIDSSDPTASALISFQDYDLERDWAADPGPSTRYRDVMAMTSGGTRLFVHIRSHWGCGSGCESQQVVVSDRPLPYSLPESPTPEVPFASTPWGSGWSFYEGPRETVYTVGIVNGHMQVYRIARPDTWSLSCEIELEPANVRESSDPLVQETTRSLDTLEKAVAQLAGGAGNCGSNRTAGRWANDVHESLARTLFRPWTSTRPLPRGYESENSYGDYDRNFHHLTTWSLTGVVEHRSFKAYNAQLATTIRQLAVFYRAKYRWSETESERMAQSALKAAISKGFGFYMYEPFAQQAQRNFAQAVLDGRPMTEIRNMPLDLAAFESVQVESLFNAAVTYPDALRYLLENGADPNMVNAFGKTPLMYAAQYDQPEAVEILLDHQADPNAATKLATDTCNYTLETSNMTPLHYAVRYGSGRLVQTLVERGAVTFIRTQRVLGEPGEYPIDWLHKYTAENASECNPNLSDADVKRLEALLRLPDKEELGRISAKLTQFSESEYAADRTQSAYQALRIALSAQENNQRALDNLSLIALKAGQIGASLEASDKIIAANVSRSSVARAWFNRGLACDKGGRFFNYNGRYYCTHSRPYAFLMSWHVEPSAARRNTLVELFTRGLPTCFVPEESAHAYFEVADDDDDRKYSSRQLVYIHHPTARKLDPDSVHWTMTVPVRGGTNTRQALGNRYPTLVATYELGPSRISVLASDEHIRWPVSIGAGKCDVTSLPRK